MELRVQDFRFKIHIELVWRDNNGDQFFSIFEKVEDRAQVRHCLTCRTSTMEKVKLSEETKDILSEEIASRMVKYVRGE